MEVVKSSYFYRFFRKEKRFQRKVDGNWMHQGKSKVRNAMALELLLHILVALLSKRGDVPMIHEGRDTQYTYIQFRKNMYY